MLLYVLVPCVVFCTELELAEDEEELKLGWEKDDLLFFGAENEKEEGE